MTPNTALHWTDALQTLEAARTFDREIVLGVGHIILNAPEGIPAVDIARNMGISQATTSRVAHTLINTSLVVRKANLIERPGRPLVPLAPREALIPTLAAYNRYHRGYLADALGHEEQKIDELARKAFAVTREVDSYDYADLSTATGLRGETISHISLLAFATGYGLRRDMLRDPIS